MVYYVCSCLVWYMKLRILGGQIRYCNGLFHHTHYLTFFIWITNIAIPRVFMDEYIQWIEMGEKHCHCLAKLFVKCKFPRRKPDEHKISLAQIGKTILALWYYDTLRPQRTISNTWIFQYAYMSLPHNLSSCMDEAAWHCHSTHMCIGPSQV